jgi:hypothetical protein
MARVDRFERAAKSRHTVHDVVRCNWYTFTSPAGSRYFQIDTYGRPGRKDVDDVSQSFQLDARAARRLRDLLDEVFAGDPEY